MTEEERLKGERFIEESRIREKEYQKDMLRDKVIDIVVFSVVGILLILFTYYFLDFIWLIVKNIWELV